MTDTTTENKDTVTNDGQPSPPSPSNPDRVQRARDEFQDETDSKREERQESQSLADRILNARERKTVTLDLEGQDIDFKIMLGETRDEIDDIEMEINDIISKAENADDDAEVEEIIGMSEDEAVARVKEYRERFIEILVDHATDDSLTYGFWLEAYGRNGAGRMAMRLKEQSERADMSEEELSQFPGQRNR